MKTKKIQKTPSSLIKISDGVNSVYCSPAIDFIRRCATDSNFISQAGSEWAKSLLLEDK